MQLDLFLEGLELPGEEGEEDGGVRGKDEGRGGEGGRGEGGRGRGEGGGR